MVRPLKPRDEKQSVRLILNLTRDEKKQLDAAAARAGLPVATFARLRVVARNEES
jgi:hypothetical protein